MPITYPSAPPTVTGDGTLTISRFLNSPALVERRLRTLLENRFIADVLLQARVTPTGGAIQFEQTETIFPDRAVEAIEPGAEFPLTTMADGPSVIAAVRKWGIDAEVTDEAIRRLQRDPVDRALTKLANGVVRQVDLVGLTAINAAPVQTLAGASWATTTTDIIGQIATAIAMANELNEGYSVDTLVVTDRQYANLMRNEPIRQAMAREDQANAIYTGRMGSLMGLDVLVTSNTPDTTAALVLDRTVLGGMADEVPLSGTSIRQEENERWRLRAKRITVPFVQEPKAAVKITGV